MAASQTGYIIKKIALLFLLGICVGLAGALFLTMIKAVTAWRESSPWLCLALPLLCVGTVFVYQTVGKDCDKGNNLIIEGMQRDDIKIPGRMGVLAFVFTGLSHLFGASVGRVGTVVQIGGAFGTQFAALGRLDSAERRTFLYAGVSAGFGAVFGTPFAGALFGMELCSVGALHKKSAVACLFTSLTANAVTGLCGVTHTHYAIGSLPRVTPRLVLAVFLASILFGLTARFFSLLVHKIKLYYAKWIQNIYIRAVVSSFVVLLVIALFQTVKYNGLSTWMIDASFQGEVQWYDPVKKFILTVLSLGAGFQGGEATPLFDIGASIGGCVANLMGVSPALLAALGYVSVFGNAANVPITTVVIGLELFGVAALPYFVIAAIIGYYVTGHNSIYGAQTILRPKYSWRSEYSGKTMGSLH